MKKIDPIEAKRRSRRHSRDMSPEAIEERLRAVDMLYEFWVLTRAHAIPPTRAKNTDTGTGSAPRQDETDGEAGEQPATSE